MSKFQIGNRVKVYDRLSTIHIYIGTICELCCTGEIKIKRDGDDRTIIIWPQQCRKLVKKYRIRIWVKPDELGSEETKQHYLNPTVSLFRMPEWTEFVEVKRK